MKIGVLGTGSVGQTIATKLVQLGHEVRMGSRTADNKNAAEWRNASGANASTGTFADAAAFGEIIFNCTEGMHSLEAIKSAGTENLKGKILVDLANPLDFSKGMPATLTVCNTDSLGEQIQKELPDTKVVKTLNTVSSTLMVNPKLLPGDHTLFMSGNDQVAKAQVQRLLIDEFGWTSIIDLGDITTARGSEMLLPIWLRLFSKFQDATFNYSIVTKK